MGFTTSCFIRKNTKELRLELERLGYKCRRIDTEFFPHIQTEKDVLISKDRYGAFHGCNCGYKGQISNGIPFSMLIEGVDCDDNEELFLAIAALRDDTDKFQWFVCDYSPDEKRYKKGDWYLSNEEVFLNGNYHKAIVEELIEHFKK